MRQPGWINRDEREPASFPGVVIAPNGDRIAVMISNVSESGCRVESHETLPIAATVDLEIGDKVLSAEVRWALDGSAGLRLIEC